MPDFTITLSAKAVQRLKAVLQRYNDNQGTSLTLKQFLRLHVQEMAIADDMAAATAAIMETVQRDAATAQSAAIRTARDELIQELQTA